jgi:hypothetical protein
MAQLNCHITGGVQEHETGVLIDGVEQQYEAIVDDRLIARHNGANAGQIRVAIVAADDTRAAYLVELPRQVTMGGRRIWVPKTSVEGTA